MCLASLQLLTQLCFIQPVMQKGMSAISATALVFLVGADLQCT